MAITIPITPQRLKAPSYDLIGLRGQLDQSIAAIGSDLAHTLARHMRRIATHSASGGHLQTTNIGDVLFIETHRGQDGTASGQGGKPKKTASGSLALNHF